MNNLNHSSNPDTKLDGAGTMEVSILIPLDDSKYINSTDDSRKLSYKSTMWLIY